MEKKTRPSSLGGKLSKDIFFGTSTDLPRILELDLDKIHPNPNQPRKNFNEERLAELADSIEKHGLIQPIVVKKNPAGEDYLLVAGERRYRAHKRLGKPTIPAIITEGNADELALIENIQREDLNPIEAAEALAQMIERYRYTHEELGKVIGKARTTVSELLRLNDLPRAIKDDCRTADGISKSVLLEISRFEDPQQQVAAWEAVKMSGFTVRALRLKKAPARKVSRPLRDLSLETGRRFIRALERLKGMDFSQDSKGSRELLAIGERVSGLIEELLTKEVTIPVKVTHDHQEE